MTSPTGKAKPRPSKKTPVKQAEPPRNWLAEAALKASVDTDGVRSVCDWLAEQFVSDEFAKLGQGGHTEARIPLRRVFVDLPLGTRFGDEAPEGPTRAYFLKTLMDLRPARLDEHCTERDLDIDEEDAAFDMRTSGIERDVEEHPCAGMVLVGGPGQGKSTLGQLACQLQRAAILRAYRSELPSNVLDVLKPFEDADGDEPKGTKIGIPTEPLFPVRIVLPEAAGWLSKNAAEFMEDGEIPILLRYLAEQASAKKANLQAETLRAFLSATPFLLLLDGLDEVGAIEDRGNILRATRELLVEMGKQGGRAVVVATTRPQGYAGELSRLGVPLATKHLAQLNVKDALAYAKRLIEADISGVDEQARALPLVEEAAKDPATARLLRTPLQVTIMVALVQHGRAPTERWKLFYNYFDQTYKREIAHQSYASKLLKERRTHIEAIHTRVALLLQVESEIAGGAASRMSRERLHEIVDVVLKEDEIKDEERADLVQKIVDAAERRLVFLVEPETGSFGFEIRSLQEFMAAWALAEGREAAIEKRLFEVAKVPLFTNVVLFMASKFFTDRSPLRDRLADGICSALDADPSDALLRATKAGALLALEILQEGSATAFPKRARALMERATGLLDLPAMQVHARLARIANDETVPVLKAAVEARLARSQADASIDAWGAWACVLQGAYLEQAWAREVGEAYWQTIKVPTLLLHACRAAGVPIGIWLASKIEAKPEDFPPESLYRHNLRWGGIVVNAQHRWPLTFAQAFFPLRKGVDVNGGEYVFNALHDRSKHLLDFWKILATMPSPPARWIAWVAAAQFEVEPSAKKLAATLKVIAESAEGWTQSGLVRNNSWPLGACVNSAKTPDDLQRFADMAARGELGDVQDWTQAEEHWLSPAFKGKRLEPVEDGVPWALHSLRNAPPTSIVGIDPRRERNAVPIAARSSANLAESIDRAIERRVLEPPFLRRLIESMDSEAARTIPADSRSRLRQLVLQLTPLEPRDQRNMLILRVWLGALTAAELDSFVQKAKELSAHISTIWDDIYRALTSSDLSESIQEQLLLRIQAAIEPQWTHAASLVHAMRRALVSRRSGLSNPGTWNRLELPLPPPLVPKPILSRLTIPDKPVCIRELRLQHIRGIRQLKLEFEPPRADEGQWIVFLGPNGAGKTTLLRALALALRNLQDPAIWPDGMFEFPWCEYGANTEAQIVVKLDNYGEHSTLIRPNGKESLRQAPEHNSPRLFPLFAYGARRGSALGKAAKEVNLDEDGGPEIATLFDERAPLIHAETWLKEWEGDARKSAASNAVYEAVISALKSLLAVESIEVESRHVWVREKDGRRIPFRSLSDGYISTAGWFLDLIARWIELATRAKVAIRHDFMQTQMTGLVLLDEIDLFLHPSWQTEVIRRTRELLPRMSFVVTTHNPLTLVGAKPEQIWILSREDRNVRAEQGVETPMLLTGGQIYSRYFGIQDIYPSDVGRKLRRYGFLSGFSMRDDAEQAEMVRLREELKTEGIEPGWEEVPQETLESPPKPKGKKKGAA